MAVGAREQEDGSLKWVVLDDLYANQIIDQLIHEVCKGALNLSAVKGIGPLRHRNTRKEVRKPFRPVAQ